MSGTSCSVCERDHVISWLWGGDFRRGLSGSLCGVGITDNVNISLSSIGWANIALITAKIGDSHDLLSILNACGDVGRVRVEDPSTCTLP